MIDLVTTCGDEEESKDEGEGEGDESDKPSSSNGLEIELAKTLRGWEEPKGESDESG